MSGGPDPAQLLEAAHAWLAEDPDPDTRAELAALLETAESDDAAAAKAALAELADRFVGPLQFGTAGLRGALGAGPNRMNRAVVIRAAAGLGAYLREHGGDAIVIGYDARHKSDVFAADTAAVMTGLGIRAVVLPRPLPTPVLAFAIRHLGVDAGVMVTASHNPPQDNGYKVYLGDGSQIVPPTDAEISARIAAVGPLAEVFLPDNGWDTLTDADVLEPYLDRVAALVRQDAPRDLRIVYTPLHGVGGEVAHAAFLRAGFRAPAVVPLQALPDPDFPTVAFPNPEEPGALDLAFAAARESAADLVIANDPDADRCAVAVPDPQVPGGWRMLRGDELGALLGQHVARRGVPAGAVFATSIVSSSLLGKIAAAAGIGYTETLTGFKWISRVPGLAFGYEEALGYCVDPDGVRDKDGISAALLIAELAATLKAEGRSLRDVLDELAREHGLHATDQLAVRVSDPSLIDEAVRRLRAHPPTTLAGQAVESIEDLATGVDGLPPTEALRCRLADAARVVVRPSGTEPKIKCYLEVVEDVADGNVSAARARAAAELARLKADVAAAAGLPV
ncbi:MAG TPA: phospho-sugar mutase [Actinomycetes bacterium]|nr:phospho-sugar mutase [Actinomycetes bacterium]